MGDVKVVLHLALKQDEEELLKSYGISSIYLEWGRRFVINPLHLDRNNFFSNTQTNYQLSVITDRQMYAVCPFTGKILTTRDSFPLAARYIFYRFVSEGKVFFVVNSTVGAGYPRNYMYFPEWRLVVCLNWLTKNREIPVLKSSLGEFEKEMQDNAKDVEAYINNPSRRTILMIDCGHFAHNTMNEMSGLYNLIQANYLRFVQKIIVRHEPILPLEEILPEAASKIERYQPDTTFRHHLRRCHFLVRSGDFYVPHGLIHRINEACFRWCPELVAEVIEARDKHFPLIWISIRAHNRRWLSQADGIPNIVNRLREKYPKLGVILDGWSDPWNGVGRNKKVQLELKLVSSIKQKFNPGVDVYSTIGSQLYESFIWAHGADLYLCNHGTAQHKIAWFARKPGVVHGNFHRMKFKELKQLGVKVMEDPVSPIFVAKEHVADEAQGHIDSNFNYECDWKVLYGHLEAIITKLNPDRGPFVPA
jgi:hypothetical protein